MSNVETQVVTCNSCGSSESSLIANVKDFGHETCDNEFHYVQCAFCGHIFLKNRPTLSELNVIYPQTYSTYNYNEYLGSVLTKAREIVQKMKIKPIASYASPSATIVDVGCGNGELLRIMKQYGPKTWNLVGVDFSEFSAQCLDRLGIRSINQRYEDLDWGEGAPDVIIMNQVIEHLEDPKHAIKKTFEYLKPGGIYMFETPSADSWDYWLFKSRHWGGWHCPRHWNIYRPETVIPLLESAGFVIEKVEFTLNPYAWLHSFQYYLKDRWGMKRLAGLFQESVFVTTALMSCIDVIQKILRGRTSNMRIIARKPLELK